MVCSLALPAWPFRPLQQEPDAHLLFQYGPEAGDRRFIEALAKFLSEEYHDPVDP